MKHALKEKLYKRVCRHIFRRFSAETLDCIISDNKVFFWHQKAKNSRVILLRNCRNYHKLASRTGLERSNRVGDHFGRTLTSNANGGH